MRIGHDLLRADVSDDAAHAVNSATACAEACLTVGDAAQPTPRFLLLATQPSLLICLPRAIASAPAGTSSVIDEPAAT